MLAFHNEHIASCAFLTYFTPDSTTASTSPTALSTTAAAASILNDKQALTGMNRGLQLKPADSEGRSEHLKTCSLNDDDDAV